MTPSVPTATREPVFVRWLRGDAADRARFADMHLRFRNAPLFGIAIGSTKLVASFWYGPWLLALMVAAGLVMAAGLQLHPRVRWPEVNAAVAFTLLEANLAVSVLITGGATSALLPLLAVPVFSQAVCFRPKVFLVGVLASGAIAAPAVLLAPTLPTTSQAPPVVHLAGYLALLACLALAGQFLATSDLSSRDEAVLDPMTGLFNRLTLAARFTEAQRDAGLVGGSVGLVMVDVDHFKVVNDTHGHDRGDQVLQQLADRFLSCLRSTDVAYRVGGEEFVVLLPGRDAEAATRVAERVRSAVAASPLAGLPVTVSAGVVSSSGNSDTLASLLREADAALYRAKGAGRNRVAAA